MRSSSVFCDCKGLLKSGNESPITFHHSVYFRAEKHRMVVLAVFHGSRNPAVWQSVYSRLCNAYRFFLVFVSKLKGYDACSLFFSVCCYIHTDVACRYLLRKLYGYCK